MSERDESAAAEASETHSETVPITLTAHERRIEEDTRQILVLLQGFAQIQEADRNERRALRDRLDRLDERISRLPTREEVDVLRVEMARLGESLSGLHHALGETNRQLEEFRAHTLDEYDRLGRQLKSFERRHNGNGHDHGDAERDDG